MARDSYAYYAVAALAVLAALASVVLTIVAMIDPSTLSLAKAALLLPHGVLAGATLGNLVFRCASLFKFVLLCALAVVAAVFDVMLAVYDFSRLDRCRSSPPVPLNEFETSLCATEPSALFISPWYGVSLAVLAVVQFVILCYMTTTRTGADDREPRRAKGCRVVGALVSLALLAVVVVAVVVLLADLHEATVYRAVFLLVPAHALGALLMAVVAPNRVDLTITVLLSALGVVPAVYGSYYEIDRIVHCTSDTLLPVGAVDAYICDNSPFGRWVLPVLLPVSAALMLVAAVLACFWMGALRRRKRNE